MPFCNTPRKWFSAFQLSKNHHTANYHKVIQTATIQALTCPLRRKESALRFIICRGSLYLGKLEGTSKEKINHPSPTEITEIQLEDAKLTSLLLLSALQSQLAPPFCTCQIPPLKRKKKVTVRATTCLKYEPRTGPRKLKISVYKARILHKSTQLAKWTDCPAASFS